MCDWGHVVFWRSWYLRSDTQYERRRRKVKVGDS
jgi:hypothetical protein